jgi:starch synthase
MERAKDISTPKLVGVMGSGLIGTDPYGENAWSGCSRYFFSECDQQGILHRAFGIEVGNLKRIPLILKNYSPKRDLWRQKFYLDTRYYECLSKAIVSSLAPADRSCALLQIGGIYNLKELLPANARVFSYHDGNLAQFLKSPYFPGEISRARIRRALEYERCVYQNNDMIFTMSEYLRNSFVNDFGVDPKKVRTIGAGINLDSVPKVKKKDYEKKNILFLGADFERKGGMDLLRAFKIVRSVHPTAKLNIIGPRNLHIAADLCAGVVYHGFLSKKNPVEGRKFNEIMEGSSLFVMPSLYEPFGIAPLEAMVYQIPAILTDAWAFPEMVTPGTNGDLVTCGSVNELAEKMIGVLANPERLQRMGEAAREMVLRKFTWQAVVNNLVRQIRAEPERNMALDDVAAACS